MHGFGHLRSTMVNFFSEDWEADFARRFHRSVVCVGADYLMETDEERRKSYVSQAACQGYRMEASEFSGLCDADLFQRLLPPGAVARLAEWMSMAHAEPILQTGLPYLFDVFVLLLLKL